MYLFAASSIFFTIFPFSIFSPLSLYMHVTLHMCIYFIFLAWPSPACYFLSHFYFSFISESSTAPFVSFWLSWVCFSPLAAIRLSPQSCELQLKKKKTKQNRIKRVKPSQSSELSPYSGLMSIKTIQADQVCNFI